ncbi:hypothetical protein COCON_G00091950 [Conger conger]|uniref:Uncharacterized protein n=1 Tax=Conger conger TaxID=82655 RepID=A0A9Q1DL72_CONCO|nr:hypothetical protein COCON_G00091950 [Conger conger]
MLQLHIHGFLANRLSSQSSTHTHRIRNAFRLVWSAGWGLSHGPQRELPPVYPLETHRTAKRKTQLIRRSKVRVPCLSEG